MVSVIQPVGSICAWLKNLSGVPSLPGEWVECDGQTLNDPASVYNGKVIPNLNGQNRYLKGYSTSGSTGGGSHNHSTSSYSSGYYDIGGTRTEYNPASGSAYYFNSDHKHTVSVSTSSIYIEPPHYQVVWIMRIK